MFEKSEAAVTAPPNELFNSKSELTPTLVALIESALKQSPELASISINTFSPKDDFDAGGYYELEQDEQGNITPSIYISLGEPELLAPLMEIRKESIKINAELLGTV